jgi:hypothetical protein
VSAVENPYAFPALTESDEYNGMTMRDYFAAQALYPIVALLGRDVGTADALAMEAYTVADAMLAARAGNSARPVQC